MTAPPRIVIDTQTVMDALLFHEPRVAPLWAAVAAGRVHWLATARMRAEMLHVVVQPRFARWRPDAGRIHAAFNTWAQPCTEPARHPLLRCRDPDDQMFLDLASAAEAQWLITRDRDLRVLSRRAARQGLAILTPQQWQAAASA